MINAPQLLADLTRELKLLVDDLRQRIIDQPELSDSLRTEWQAARNAKRCAATFPNWTDQTITQAGVHWLLSCVFVRFIEDNQLVDRPWLGGTPDSGRLALARDRHEAYFQVHPTESDRDYLLTAFREAGALPGLHTFFNESHNPVFRLGISGDAAIALRAFWQQVDPNTGALRHDFTDASWTTRFLGDLYENLSEATRKRYALRQTPTFVEEFILDRTLTPAIRTFGFREVRMIDPTCGSGHFLLGGFARMVAEWQRHEPARNPGDIAQKALAAVAGVDLNPFAVAISRFRLLVAALQVAGVRKLADSPNFRISVAIGDSLLHGVRFGMTGTQSLLGDDQFVGTGLAHAYASEDLAEVQSILARQYHAVVGNPPYIVVKDAALNAAYRAKYASCYRQYSLGCPFTERFFDLAITGDATANRPAGYVGQITANSFMKREFGRRLIEGVLPRLDLTHVIDTSGAFIPGHGTPTVILLGRHQAPMGDDVRTVMGIRGEPNKPDDAAQGLVWRAIVDQIDDLGSESQYLSVVDLPRETLNRYPWSIDGGGASAIKAEIEAGTQPLSSLTTDLGFVCITKADDVFVLPASTAKRHGCEAHAVRPFVEGEDVRDWVVNEQNICVFPYTDDVQLLSPETIPAILRLLWRSRTVLEDRKAFGGATYREAGRVWYSYGQIPVSRFKLKRSIAVSFVATQNNFALDRLGKVFKQTAPVVKLSASATEDEHLGLLGLLNSSTASFWMKNTLFDRGNGGIGGGIAAEEWERFYEFASTPLKGFPLPDGRPTLITRELDATASALVDSQPERQVRCKTSLTRRALDDRHSRSKQLQGRLLSLQEELDWECYALYGLLPAGSCVVETESTRWPELKLGERAFEIVLSRHIVSGDETTTWFERHGSTPVTDLPEHWPADYRSLVERRIALIESDRNIGLIERPEFKRRWNSPAWNDLEEAALRAWLLDRLEHRSFWPAGDRPPQLTTSNRLADLARSDSAFMEAAVLYAGYADFDLVRLVAELVMAEAVPLMPVLRYTDDGLRKRTQWEATWTLQRREDAIDAQVWAENADQWRSEFAEIARTTFGSESTDKARAWIDEKLAFEIKRHQDERKTAEVGPIPVPPKYKSSDFLKSDFWRLRGGLDVPKERFVSFPGAERGADGSLVIAWAGWNHLEQASALAGYYVEMKDTEGWEPTRLQPLLAGLLELVPWLEQWHNDLDPVFGERMGTYYKGFVTEEARALGFTLDDLRAWKPATTAAKRGRKKAAAASEG